MATVDTSMRLPSEEYFAETQPKSGLCIHHTVGGSARSTFDWWMADRTGSGRRRRVGTAYIIARDGTVHEVFDPEAWAYQFGLRWPLEQKLAFEKRFVGIELANRGPLIERDGQLYCFDRVSDGTRVDRDTAFDFGEKWRRYRFYTPYPEVQLTALIELVDTLCDRFSIPRAVPEDPLAFFGQDLSEFSGIIGHTMVRPDKTDPNPDAEFWRTIVTECRLVEVGVQSEPPTEGQPMTDTQIEALGKENAQEINRLEPAAGGLVAGMLRELRKPGRDTYLRLSDGQDRGHTVRYAFVEGDRDLIGKAAKALGFKSWSDGVMEVHSG